MKGKIPWQTADDWPLRLPELEIDPQRTALVVVDMQNFSELGRQVLPQCRQLLEFFRARELTVIHLLVGPLLADSRDMHSKRRAYNNRKQSIQEPGRHWPKGAWEHDPVEELMPRAGELVVNKNSSGAFNSTAIDHFLRALEVQNLVFCGEATSGCVENTSRTAADRGYNVVMVEDALADNFQDKHQATLHTFGRALGSVKTTSQVIEELSMLLAAEPALAGD